MEDVDKAEARLASDGTLATSDVFSDTFGNAVVG